MLGDKLSLFFSAGERFLRGVGSLPFDTQPLLHYFAVALSINVLCSSNTQGLDIKNNDAQVRHYNKTAKLRGYTSKRIHSNTSQK